MEALSLGNILSSSAMLIGILVLGWFTKSVRLLPPSTFEVLSTVIVWITLPALLLSIANDLVIDANTGMLILMGILVSLALSLTGALIMARQSRQDQGFAILNTSGHNIGLFAMPYLTGILGPAAALPALAFDVGHGMTISGASYLAGISRARPDLKITARALARNIFASPVFMVYLFIVLMRAFGLTLPSPVVSFTSMIGQANTFLALFMLGVGLKIALPGSKYLAAARILLVRFIVCLVFALVTWFFLPLDDTSRTILVTIYFSPVASVMAAFTLKARGDIELSSFIISASILLSLITMPAALILMASA